MRPAVSHDTFFKMATLIPAGKNVQMKARLILLRKLKGWGKISLPAEKAKIASERKIQTSPAGKNLNKTNFKCKQVKSIKNSNYSETFSKFRNFSATLQIK